MVEWEAEAVWSEFIERCNCTDDAYTLAYTTYNVYIITFKKYSTITHTYFILDVNRATCILNKSDIWYTYFFLVREKMKKKLHSCLLIIWRGRKCMYVISLMAFNPRISKSKYKHLQTYTFSATVSILYTHTCDECISHIGCRWMFAHCSKVHNILTRFVNSCLCACFIERVNLNKVPSRFSNITCIPSHTHMPHCHTFNACTQFEC